MKYVIDENICKKRGINLPTLLAIMLVKTGVDVPSFFNTLIEKEVFIRDLFSGGLAITQRWNSICDDVLLSSDNEIPSSDRLDPLVTSLMDIFPKGKKEGTNVYWRGNKKDIKERLQKFFKLYGSTYSDEQIITAATEYVKSFNGQYGYMRVLKYFIWKDIRKIDSDNKGYIEEVSELASYIENAGHENEKQDWTSTLK